MRTNFWHIVVLEDQLVNWKMYANIIMQALKKINLWNMTQNYIKLSKFELIKSLKCRIQNRMHNNKNNLRSCITKSFRQSYVRHRSKKTSTEPNSIKYKFFLTGLGFQCGFQVTCDRRHLNYKNRETHICFPNWSRR